MLALLLAVSGCAVSGAATPVTLASRLSGFIWPLPVEHAGSVTSQYGPRWGRHHNGLDLDGESGDPVYATSAGTVSFSGSRRGYGETVVIDHGGGVTTLYGHLATRYVRRGQRLARAQPVGAVGASGNATGPHLHFEVAWAGYPVDPLPLLPRLR